MKKCSKCGKEVAEEAKFCPNCGSQAAGVTPEAEKSAEPAGKPAVSGNRTVLILAVAAVLITAIGVFLACGGWDYLFGTRQPSADVAAVGTMQQGGTEQTAQTPANMGQPPADTANMGQPPGDTAQVPGPAGPEQPGPSVAKKRPEQQSHLALQGRWEGTWNAGIGSSGSCTATIKKAGFTTVCYDNRFAGRITMDRRGNYLFEGGNSTWTCRIGYDRRRTVLKCSYTFKAGASGSSGSLSLYKESQPKGSY